jgi:dTDP-4-amino-4,6-dideoxygalactose transaminase
MIVPFVDLKAQYRSIKLEILEVIEKILEDCSFIKGPYVKAFESGFARLHDVKFCIGTSSGTDSLHLALLALDVGAGDLVILPVNTFFATAEAVSLCGGVPVFVDCNDHFNIDIQKIEEVFERRKDSKIKAVMPVHLYGQSADMKEILELSVKYDLKILEDACQAHLAKYELGGQGFKGVGSIGNIGTFSFFPGKNLGAYGEAGAVVTNDEGLYEKMKLIHNHGSKVRYHHDVIGHNYRMEAIQGAVLSVKLKYIEEWTQRRQKNADIYNELLKNVDEVTAPETKKGRTHSFHLYVIRCKDRDALKRYLEEHGIATGLHYPVPLHLQPAYEHLGYRRGDFPVAEKMADEILSLPMYPELTENQIDYVVDNIKNFYSQGKLRHV